MTKKPVFLRKTKFRLKKRISEKISYICTVRATEANDQPCNIRLSAPRRTPRNDDDVHVHVQPFSPGVAPSCTENDTIRLRRGRIFLSDFLTTDITYHGFKKVPFRNPPDSCGPATRRTHRRPGRGDLSHGGLPVQKLRPRRPALRVERGRQHLYAPAKPHHDGLRTAHRRPVRGRGGARRLLRHVGHPDRRAFAGGRGRQHRRLALPLRRHVQPVPHVAAKARHRLPHRSERASRGFRGADRQPHQGALRREHGQSHLRGPRPGGAGRTGPAARHSVHRRQHVRRGGLPLQPVRVGREHRRGLRDEVDQRPRDGHGRRDRRRRQLQLGERQIPADRRTFGRVSRA